ncbi:diaminopimelate epimerase [Lactobacillus sp. DCY120]|uniref:Diaminopimelate epimerase n=1 Tax=Bombilactobacillus apium TaxID=2675299 RepID=A0A850R4W0_9LACO|nr:diaminopimelate epimerase [Bombilactobacillus apium]NVY95612.1 diaminopimelate epimerase [Bombilactobacillus apium]
MVVLQKVHGSNNQFFLLDQTTLTQALNSQELQNLAQKITKKDFFGGVDGLLVVDSSSVPAALGKMRVYNADGSRALMCGNGLRTVSRYLATKHQQDQFLVETDQANLQVQKQTPWAPQIPAYSVEISPVSFQANKLPFANLGTDQLINQIVPQFDPQLKFTALAVPNPHLISFVSAAVMEGPLLKELGEKLNQTNPYFPEGVNLSFAQVKKADELFVRTFERGVGFTNACGTGMSATSLAYFLTQPQVPAMGTQLTIKNPGGMVQTRVHQGSSEQYWIELSGNATVIAEIQLPEADLRHGNLQPENYAYNETGEALAYQNFVQQLS